MVAGQAAGAVALRGSDGTGGAPPGSWWQQRRQAWLLCLAAELRDTWGHDFAEGLPDAEDLLVLVRRTAAQAAAVDLGPAHLAAADATHRAARRLAAAVPALEAAARLWQTGACALACRQLRSAARSLTDAGDALRAAPLPPRVPQQPPTGPVGARRDRPA